MRTYISSFISAVVVAVLAIAALPASALAVIDTQLDFGDRNAEVTELQSFLATDPSIYPEGLVTGYFGPLTQAAVERFQCRHNIVCSGTPTTTGYGRIGPITRNTVNASMGTGGGTNGGAVIDNSAPIMTADTVNTTATSATINWQTTENATSRVMYGTTWPFLYSTAPSAADTTFNTDQSVTLTGLQPNTTYFYVRESTDASGNIMWTTAQTFQTD